MHLMVLLCILVATDAGAAIVNKMSAVGDLKADQVAIVVNDADANSVAVATYYQQARNIPQKHVVHVRIPNSPRKLSVSEFNALKQQIEAHLGPEIQAILLVWTAPYAVECNSITAALTLGFDAAQCKNTCAPGKPSPYFDSNSRRSYTDFGIRISMLLPTDSIAAAKSLINRGVLSNFRLQPASAYFLILKISNAARAHNFFRPPGRLRRCNLKSKRCVLMKFPGSRTS